MLIAIFTKKQALLIRFRKPVRFIKVVFSFIYYILLSVLRRRHIGDFFEHLKKRPFAANAAFVKCLCYVQAGIAQLFFDFLYLDLLIVFIGAYACMTVEYAGKMM